MMNVRIKLSENDLPEHHPLIFNQGYDIDHIIMIREYVYFITKKNSTEYFEAFHYREKFLLGRSVVILWLD